MSKITFRADDDLVDELESFDASKSEVMRDALRAYLHGHSDSHVNAPEDDVNGSSDDGTIDEVVERRVDELIEERLDRLVGRSGPQDVNVNITLDGDSGARVDADAEARKTDADARGETRDGGRKTCGQCGENVGPEHVYCPNCGEKASRRVFCDCGDELRSDWAFCPSCGRRTPAADVLDST